MTMGRPTSDYELLHSGSLVHKQGMNLSYSFTLLCNSATRLLRSCNGRPMKQPDRQMRNKHDKIQEYHTAIRLTFSFILTRLM